MITQEDIRRSGATSIPEALRLAPGIQVARIDGGRWSIGMRGFADRLARSMLVLMDGRALYSPLFAGTYWEVQDTLMENIDGIEVVRAPGGTLWGANAVNGVINIITKSSRDTQGMTATLDAGNGRGLGAFQFGGTARGGAMTYRFFGKGATRENEFNANGLDFDQTRVAEGGFRSDWTMARGRRFTLQGDAYTIRLGSRGTLTQYESPFTTTFERRSPLSGGNVLARLTGSMGTNATFQLQTYYDHTSRNELPVSEDRDTVDIDFQQTQRRWNTHQLT